MIYALTNIYNQCKNSVKEEKLLKTIADYIKSEPTGNYDYNSYTVCCIYL